jgi:hypothetical protein
VLTAALDAHEIRQLEGGQVVAERGRLQASGGRQLAGRALAAPQHPQDRPTVRIGQRAVRFLEPHLYI